jgi:hypothetical protein
MHILGTVNNLISVQLNHFQLLFLLRMMEMISEITTFLAQDVRHILGEEDESSVAVGLILPQIDASLIMPSISQSKDSVGGDYDSFAPDSSSVYSATDADAADADYIMKASAVDELSGAAVGGGARSDQRYDLNKDQDDTSVSLGTSSSQCSVPNSPPLTVSRTGVGGDGGGDWMSTGGGGGNMLTIARSPTVGSSCRGSENVHSSLTPSTQNINTTCGGDTSPTFNEAANPPSTRQHHHRQQPELDEVDLTSVKSDGSSDSENFVIVGQAEDHSDSALFKIHSKRASPVVEVAAEVTEDLQYKGSSQYRLGAAVPLQSAAAAKPSNYTPLNLTSTTPQPPVKRDGMVNLMITLITRSTPDDQ